MISEQIRYSFDAVTRSKIVRGAIIAMGGALCAYLLSVIPNMQMGEWTPVITAVASIVINAIYQWCKGQPV